MGSGSWTKSRFMDYSRKRGRNLTDDGAVAGVYGTQEMFCSRRLSPELNPFQAVRECCDSDEHPNTHPVILALDVTGSMGSAAVEVAKKLNIVMSSLYERVKDVECLVMGIGDLSYDQAPIQASQFESDIRIAEQLDKLFFEGGGGGNTCESYTAAWYFGLNHTKLDCWKRGEKGLIITMGDEALNPYLPYQPLCRVTGDNLQKDIETKELYPLAARKFDLYHLAVDGQTCYSWYKDSIKESFGVYLDEKHLRVVTLDNLSDAIIEIVVNHFTTEAKPSSSLAGTVISW